MSKILVQIAPDTERRLRRRAELAGETLEAFLEKLAERAAADGSESMENVAERYISNPNPDPSEFNRLLKELATGQPLPILPADFTRADIYDDHD